jgi:hypothetical protein
VKAGTNDRLPLEDLRKLTLRSHDWLRVDFENARIMDGKALVRGEAKVPLPLHAGVGQAGKVGDLVGTLWASVYAITSRLKVTLEKAGLTGWLALPVRGPDAVVWESFWVLAITGRCGPVYGQGGLHHAGIDPAFPYLDPSKWDGTDLFMPENNTVILLAPRAAQALRRAHLRNVALEPVGFLPIQ